MDSQSDQFVSAPSLESSFLAYYDQQVLASYRNEADKYLIETDSFEGTLTSRSDSDQYVRIRFGYRTLANGNLALVAIAPDLAEAGEHLKRWSGFRLISPNWSNNPDHRFEKWYTRYIEGCWSVENGPRFHLADVMKTINSLTIEAAGEFLYKSPVKESLAFPSAENTHAYQDAHKELYGYVIDGLRKDGLNAIAKWCGNSPNISSDKTIAALKRILPAINDSSSFCDAMDCISEQRRLATHGIRDEALRFSSFDQFTEDMELCLRGLQDLLTALESTFKISGESARRRQDALAQTAKITRSVPNVAGLKDVSRMVGKTIKAATIGERESWSNLHGSELIKLEFEDGSQVCIDTGSNAGNLCREEIGLSADQFHIDYLLFWIPALQKIED